MSRSIRVQLCDEAATVQLPITDLTQPTLAYFDLSRPQVIVCAVNARAKRLTGLTSESPVNMVISGVRFQRRSTTPSLNLSLPKEA